MVQLNAFLKSGPKDFVLTTCNQKRSLHFGALVMWWILPQEWLKNECLLPSLSPEPQTCHPTASSSCPLCLQPKITLKNAHLDLRCWTPTVFLVSMNSISILLMLQERTWTQIFLYSLIHIQLSKKLYLLYFKIYLESAISCDPPFHHPIQFTIIPHLVYFNSFQTSLSDSILLLSGYSQHSNQDDPFEVEIRTCQLSATHLLRLPISQKEKPSLTRRPCVVRLLWHSSNLHDHLDAP